MTGRGPEIRLAADGDVDAMLAIYTPVVRETAISFELEPPSAEEFRTRLAATLERFPWLVCADGSDVWGYAYAGAFRARPAYRWTVETTVYIAPERRRKGVARALYVSLLAALRLAGFRCAYAGIALPNPASVAAHERLGFEPVGVFRAAGFKLGRWHDIGFWQIELGAFTPTAPPRLLPQLLADPGWPDVLARGTELLRAGDGG